MNDVPNQVTTVSDTDIGIFDVVTLSGSRYSLDLDGRLFNRVNEGVGHSLRQDGELIDLIAVEKCCLGERMELIINLHVAEVDYTRRSSTPVIRITRISGPTGLTSAASPDHISAQDWRSLSAVIEGYGGNASAVKNQANRDYVSIEAVAEAIFRAKTITAGLSIMGDLPFERWEAVPPGVIDLRVLDQGVWWIDVLRRAHRIVDMDIDYLYNVVLMLRRNAGEYFVSLRDDGSQTASPEIVEKWLDSLPLVVALRAAIRGRYR